MARTTEFTGAAGSWPALSSGDAWQAGFWASPTPTSSEIENAPVDALTGTGTASSSVTVNAPVTVSLNQYAQYPTSYPTNLAATTTVTTNSTTTVLVGAVNENYYFMPQNTVSGYSFVPSGTGVNLIFIQTSANAVHGHYIDSSRSTGSWQGQTYETIGRYDWTGSSSGSTVYHHMSIHKMIYSTYPSIPDPSSLTTGKIAFYLRDPVTAVPVSGSGYVCYPLIVNRVNNRSATSEIFRMSGGAPDARTASGSTGQPSITMPSGLAAGSVFIGMASHNNANTSTGSQTVASYSYTAPNNGSALLFSRGPANNVITANFQTSGVSTATTPWGFIAVEIPDNYHTTAVDQGSKSYVWTKLASNSVTRPRTTDTYATLAAPTQREGLTPTLFNRYSVEAGTGTRRSLAMTLARSFDPTKGPMFRPVIYQVTDNLSTTSFTTLATLTDNYSLIFSTALPYRYAMRVSPYADGQLWVCAKFWTQSEPDWPTTGAVGESYGASSYGVYDIGVLSVLLPADNPIAAMADGGQFGLGFIHELYALSNKHEQILQTPEGLAQILWDSCSDDILAYSATGAFSATGGNIAAAQSVDAITAGQAMVGTGSLAAVYARRRESAGELAGTGGDVGSESEVVYGDSQIGPYLGAVVTR